jgi:deoxyribonuclease V
MIAKLDIADGLSRDAAERLQAGLAARVVVADRFGRIDTVAGVDVAYDREGKRATAAVAVLRADDLSVVETRALETAVRFPYIPGLLSFRELPAICALLQHVTVVPDLLICDGQGIAHPRRFGLACHLGVMFDLPAIGCAKTPLLGAGREPGMAPGMARGDSTALLEQGETVGCALRTRSGVRPVYVSPGHRISVAGACEWVLKLAPRFRLPEPLRLADQAARRAQSARCEDAASKRRD